MDDTAAWCKALVDLAADVMANSPKPQPGNAQRRGARQRCGLRQFHWRGRAFQLNTRVPGVEWHGA